MNVEQRLARLERGNRRMKRIGTLVLVVAAAVLLSGAANGKDLPDLEVASLTLTDKDGKKLAWLGVNADGSPSLILADKAGKPRTALGVLADGSAALDLYDKAAKTRARLSVPADGSPGVFLYDKAGTTRARLGTLADGSPFLHGSA